MQRISDMHSKFALIKATWCVEVDYDRHSICDRWD